MWVGCIVDRLSSCPPSGGSTGKTSRSITANPDLTEGGRSGTTREKAMAALLDQVSYHPCIECRDCKCIECCYKETVLVQSAVIKRLSLYRVLL